MTLQDVFKLAEQWRNNDNKRYSVEFYNKVIADLIDRKQYAKPATGIKKTIPTG